MVGALLIIGFGISAVWPHREKDLTELRLRGNFKRRYSFLKGFAINTANPSNWLFWLGLAAAATAEPAAVGNPYYSMIFLGAALAMVLSTDVAKVLLAGKIGEWLKPGLPGKIVRAAGVVLIAVGIWLIVKIMWY